MTDPARKRKSLHALAPRSALLRHFSRQDPVMAEVMRKVGPFRLKRNRKYFLVLCKAIIAQQISTRAAAAVTSRFMSLFDNRSPLPDRVSALDEDTLRSAGLSRQKASYLKDLSRHFMEKTIRPHRLPHLDNEEIIRQLTAVRGIGRWTAEMFLIFSLNRLDVLPVDDLGLRTGLQRIYGLKDLPSAKAVRKIAEPWRPYETVATWYAWRTLDPEITAY